MEKSADKANVLRRTHAVMLLKPEQEGSTTSEWGMPENNCRARFCRLKRAGHKAQRFSKAKAGDLQ